MGKTVVYNVRDNGWVYEFTPRPESAFVLCQVHKFSGQSYRLTSEVFTASLREADTYYIVDPGKTKDSCDESKGFRPNLVLVASPNPSHWGEKYFARDKGKFRYYPVWELEELLLARPFVNPAVSREQVIERFRLFGGYPDQVFYEDLDLESENWTQQSAVNKIDAEHLSRYYKGGIFYASALELSRPNSDVFGMQSNAKTKFEKVIAVPNSVAIISMLSARFSFTLYRYLQTDVRHGKDLFKCYAGSLLCHDEKIEMTCRPWTKKRRTSDRYLYAGTELLGGCTRPVLMSNPFAPNHPFELAKDHQSVLFYGEYERYDFLYSTKETDGTISYHVFVTVDANSYVDTTSVVGLERKFGSENLTIYYLVFDAHYEKFKIHPTSNPFATQTRTKCPVIIARVPPPEDAYWLGSARDDLDPFPGS